MRRMVQRPIFASLRAGVDRAQSAATLLRELENMVFAPDLGDQAMEDALSELFAQIALWHRVRLIKTFRQALGIDVTGYLGQAAVADQLRQAIADNVALISTIPEHAHAGLERRLQKFLQSAPFDQQAVRRMLAEQYKVTSSRLSLIARDQTTKLIGQLTQIRQQEVGITSYVWLTSRDGRVRPTHAANEGRRFYWNSPPAETGHPGHDIQCFPGSVRICPAGLEASVAYRYVGELIEVTLADGVDLTTTPNHPILTKAGWKRAADIQEGDELIKHHGGSGFTESTIDPQLRYGYASAEEFHRLLGGVRSFRGASPVHVDLHGGTQSGNVEVEIVYAPSELRGSFEAVGREVFADFALESTHLSRMRVLDLERVIDPGPLASEDGSHGSVRVRSELLPVGGAHPLHANPVGFAGRSAMQTEVVHARVDDRPVDPESFRYGEDGLPVLVESHDIGVVLDAPFVRPELIARDKLDAEIVKAGIRDLASDPKLGSDLCAVLASIRKPFDVGVVPPAPFEAVRAHRTRSVRHDGAVFNFQTHTGLIIANGIVTHNCRCVPVAYIPGVSGTVTRS